MTETFVCSCCGQEYPIYDCYEVANRTFCPDCLGEENMVCTHCEERILNHQNMGQDDSPLCQNCYENHYLNCDRCGALIQRDDAHYLTSDSEEPFCYDCYCLESREGVIHDYYYKPEPIFYPPYKPEILYLGVELEIDGGGEDAKNAENLLNIANHDVEHIYAKHDGSLSSGIELVSHPCSLEYHIQKISWKEICARAVDLQYLSHKTTTAGLHIHVNRTALGSTHQEQEDTIARILYFVEAHFNEMLRFSRRTEAQLNKWAARYGYKENPKEVLDHAKNSNLGRYSSVNLQNMETIEFRLFRGTLKYQTLIAALQMVDVICKAAIVMSDDEFRSMSWSDFVMRINESKNCHLIAYLKERRLYINEPVMMEEEEI